MSDKSSTSTPEETLRVFKVEMVAIGGKFRGMLGATYNVAHQSTAYRLREEKSPIRYGDESKGEEDNIYMDVYFLDHHDSARFVRHVKEVHKVHDLVKRDHNPTFRTDEKFLRMKFSELVRMESDDFRVFTPPGSIDYGEYSQTLSSFEKSEPSRKKPNLSGASSSGKMTTRSSGKLTVLDTNDPVFIWQHLEKPKSYFGDPFRLHLMAKKHGPKEDPNNYLGGSWEFHQILDGMNCKSYGGVPGLTVEFDRVDGTWVQADDGIRHKVYLRLRFFNDANREGFSINIARRMKEGSGGWKEDGSFETFVHVLDVSSFRFFLGVKIQDTEKERRDQLGIS